MAISGNLLPEECEENTESYCALEHNVAERFGDQKSSENRRMRKEFQKVIMRIRHEKKNWRSNLSNNDLISAKVYLNVAFCLKRVWILEVRSENGCGQ